MGFVVANWKWLFSGIAFIVYVAVQHSLYIALLRACREFKHALDTNNREHIATPGGFVWFQSVRAMFAEQNGGWLANTPLPREAVIDSLDHEVWRFSIYSALQRWGMAAPLIGVILSALGFMVSPPELTGEVSDIMGKLGPLFVGVCVGAIMALVNQVYLHLAAVELGRTRAKAVAWFDEVVWRSVSQHAHNALGRAAGETQSAAKNLEASSLQLASSNITYRDSLLELNRQLSIVRTAAESTSSSFGGFTTMMENMTDQLGATIRNLSALNSTVAAIENGSVVWNVAAAKMANATAAIEDSSKKFQDGIANSAGDLLSVVSGLTEPVRKLEGSILQMQANTDKHAQVSESLASIAERSDRFLTERLALNIDEAELQGQMAKRTQAAIEALNKLAETAAVINKTGETLNVAADGLKGASTNTNGALQGLLESCTQFSSQCVDMQTKMNSGVTEATNGMQNAARELAQPVSKLTDSISRAAIETEGRAEFSERLENVSKLGERYLQDRVRASADESTRVDRIDGIEKNLAETTVILSDSASSMRELQQSLEALVHEMKLARESKDEKGGRWLSWRSTPRIKDSSAGKDKSN